MEVFTKTICFLAGEWEKTPGKTPEVEQGYKSEPKVSAKKLPIKEQTTLLSKDQPKKRLSLKQFIQQRALSQSTEVSTDFTSDMQKYGCIITAQNSKLLFQPNHLDKHKKINTLNKSKIYFPDIRLAPIKVLEKSLNQTTEHHFYKIPEQLIYSTEKITLKNLDPKVLLEICLKSEKTGVTKKGKWKLSSLFLVGSHLITFNYISTIIIQDKDNQEKTLSLPPSLIKCYYSSLTGSMSLEKIVLISTNKLMLGLLNEALVTQNCIKTSYDSIPKQKEQCIRITINKDKINAKIDQELNGLKIFPVKNYEQTLFGKLSFNPEQYETKLTDIKMLNFIKDAPWFPQLLYGEPIKQLLSVALTGIENKVSYQLEQLHSSSIPSTLSFESLNLNYFTQMYEEKANKQKDNTFPLLFINDKCDHLIVFNYINKLYTQAAVTYFSPLLTKWIFSVNNSTIKLIAAELESHDSSVIELFRELICGNKAIKKHWENIPKKTIYHVTINENNKNKIKNEQIKLVQQKHGKSNINSLKLDMQRRGAVVYSQKDAEYYQSYWCLKKDQKDSFEKIITNFEKNNLYRQELIAGPLTAILDALNNLSSNRDNYRLSNVQLYEINTSEKNLLPFSRLNLEYFTRVYEFSKQNQTKKIVEEKNKELQRLPTLFVTEKLDTLISIDYLSEIIRYQTNNSKNFLIKLPPLIAKWTYQITDSEIKFINASIESSDKAMLDFFCEILVNDSNNTKLQNYWNKIAKQESSLKI